MGRHVNYADEQDRWLNKVEKLNRKFNKKQRLEDKDPNSLTLAEQLELERRRKVERQKQKEQQPITPKKEEVWISHYRPKQK
jgi:hypothetical protein